MDNSNPNSFDPDIVRDGEYEYRRLKTKVKEYVKKNLKDYIINDSITARRGRKIVKIPIAGIRLPGFERDKKRGGGVGQGPGEDGDPLPGQGTPGPGQGRGAGTDPSEHGLEVEIIVDEILEILSESLELPNIEDRGKRKLKSNEVEYTDLRKTGPECLLDVKRTIKNSLIRMICGYPATSAPLVECPPIVIEPDDRVFKTWVDIEKEHTNAVVIAMMDISGSMGEEQRQTVQTTMFWIEEWLKKQYKDSIEIVRIVHDTTAWEVPYEDFYKIQTGGGTAISPALALCNQIIDDRFPSSEWNIYPFFFSDGDNYTDDNKKVIEILEKSLLVKSNQVCYGQVHSSYGSGEMYKLLLDKLGKEEKLCVYQMKKEDDILGAIKKFLGKGR